MSIYDPNDIEKITLERKLIKEPPKPGYEKVLEINIPGSFIIKNGELLFIEDENRKIEIEKSIFEIDNKLEGMLRKVLPPLGNLKLYFTPKAIMAIDEEFKERILKDIKNEREKRKLKIY